MPRLANKTALVTGGSRGIGRATALALAAEGARVLVHYGRSEAEAAAVVAEIAGKGGRGEAVGADLARPDGAHALAAKVRELVGDKLEILVANAGIAKLGQFEDESVDDFDGLFAVNVRAPFFLVQQLLPVLGEGSSIIFTSSVVATRAFDGLAAYAATKGAVDTLVVQLARTLGPRGIRVTAVAPGVIETDMSHFAGTEEGRKMILGIQALQRIGQPADVADVILFLASEDARWITGESIRVSGGTSL